MAREKELRFVSWEEYLHLISQLADKLNPYDFDQILAIGRGGIMLGDALTRIFHKPLNIIMVRSYRYWTKVQKAQYSTMATFFEDFGRVLIVDDLVETGDTIKLIGGKLKQFTDKPYKTACLWKKENSPITPDFFVEDVKKNVWIQQPFEIWGDYDYMRKNPRDSVRT